MSSVESRFVEVQGIRTHYLCAGEHGPVVVLLHGGGIDSARLSWGGFLAEPGCQHRVIAPDWPGYGETDRPPAAYSLDYYVQFLGAFLDAVQIEKASLCGISMGGGAALGFTLRWPERVEKLVLVDSYGLQRSVPYGKFGYLLIHAPWINELTWSMMRSRAMVRASLSGLLKRPGSLTEELVELAMQEMNRPNPGRAWREFQKNEVTWSGSRTCYMDRLGEIRAPTLIMHGEKDTLVPAECARQAQERIPKARLHWLEGSGHWPQRDDPEGFSRVVREFFNA